MWVCVVESKTTVRIASRDGGVCCGMKTVVRTASRDGVCVVE